jgi:hypothetical protein
MCKKPVRGTLAPVLYRLFQGPDKVCSMEDAAEALGVGKDMLYRCASRVSDLGAEQAVELDCFVVALTGKPQAPFTDALHRAVGIDGSPLSPGRLSTSALDLQQRLGSLAAEVRQAVADDVLTGPETRAALDAATRLAEDVQSLVTDLRATQAQAPRGGRSRRG